MEIVTFANILAILILGIGRWYKKEEKSLIITIVWLILFYSIRTDYGNDIPEYIRVFHRFRFYSFDNLINYDERFEIGWAVLNLIFQPFGWQIFLLFQTGFWFISVYYFISRFCKPKNYWLIFIFFLFSTLFLSSLSMLRQTMAMAIVLWSVPLLLNKKIIKGIIVIIVASLFHKSAIVCLIQVPIMYATKANSRVLIISYLVLFSLLLGVDVLMKNVLHYFLSFESFENFENYAVEKNTVGSGFGVLFQVIIGVLFLLNSKKNIKYKFCALSYCIGVLIIPFIYLGPSLGRLTYYFNICGLPAYALLVNSKNDSYRYINGILLILSIIILMHNYIYFFQNPVYRDHFATYHTLLETL